MHLSENSFITGFVNSPIGLMKPAVLTMEKSQIHSHMDNETVMDVKLFKFIGLLQVLKPAVSTGCVFDGQWHRRVLRVIFWTMLLTIILNIGMLHKAFNDFQRFTYLIMIIFIYINTTITGYLFLAKSDRMWDVLDLTRFAFTSCGQRDSSRLADSRVKLSAILRTIVIIGLIVFLLRLSAPFIIQERLSVVQLDGTIKKYRRCIFNIWVPLSDTMYNSLVVWPLVYAYELLLLVGSCVVWFMFVCYLMTACFALNAHFRTLAAGYEALGRTPWNGSFPFNTP